MKHDGKIAIVHAVPETIGNYGIFSVIWNGELVADHPISKTRFTNIMNKMLK